MKREMINFVARHERLRFILKCVKRFKDVEFIEKVNHMNENFDPMLLKMKQNGSENKGIIIADITIDIKAGFFAHMRDILLKLYYADMFGLTPIIRFKKGISPYEEEEPINDSDNVWEYYFESCAGMKADEINRSFRVVEINSWHRQYVAELLDKSNSYIVSEKFIDEMAHIMKKYVRMKEVISNQIYIDISEIFKGKKVLGVHVRGTDFNKGYYEHPVAVRSEEYYVFIDQVMIQENYELIFLATDDENVLNEFKKRYGNKLVYFNACRSNNAECVVYKQDDRKNHKFLLGYEVLRDMYALSYCEGLIAGISQVNICSMIAKRSRAEDYQYLKIINHGINVNPQKRIPKHLL